jgi:hypothetical protein
MPASEWPPRWSGGGRRGGAAAYRDSAPASTGRRRSVGALRVADRGMDQQGGQKRKRNTPGSTAGTPHVARSIVSITALRNNAGSRAGYL